MKETYVLTIFMLMLSVTLLTAQTPWQTASAGGVTFQYRVTQDSQNLEGKMTASTTGWVAVGFNPTSVMRNANFIIGYLSAGTGNIRDDWGTSNTTHVSDVSLGGQNNVTLVTGTESAGSTMLHFTIPLSTTDQYDRNMQIGQTYPIILAKGSADNYTGQHNDAGYASITIQAPVANDDALNPVPSLKLSGYPNPFNPQTTLRYTLEKSGELELIIFNVRGQLIHKVRRYETVGEHSYLWNADDLPGGTYIVRLRSGDSVSNIKVDLIR